MRLRGGSGTAALSSVLLAGLLVAPLQAQWPAGNGGYWAKVSLFRHHTTEQFRENGDVEPFFVSNSENRSRALFVDVLYGVTSRLDVWAQLPYFDLHFDDNIVDRHSAGIGDLRLSTRYNLLQLRGGSVPISARFTAKVPLVDFPFDAQVVPIGEGQWDLEAWLEGGVSLYPLPAYAVVWLGYRWRTRNEETQRDPGDERALLAEIGGTVVGPVGGKVVLDAILGRPGSVQGIRIPSDKREIVYLQPALTWQITPALTLEAAPRFPLQGKNFPAGPQFVIGLFHRPPQA